jgi:hypothetical protein
VTGPTSQDSVEWNTSSPSGAFLSWFMQGFAEFKAKRAPIRLVGADNGKGGTRTLDPGIMSAVLGSR